MARTAFTLNINTNGAAFTVESNDEDNGQYDPGPEVTRLLREAADKIEQGYGTVHRSSLIDINGATVGHFAFTEEG